jgi:UDP-N-acetylglucosamine--N-acetylmuramyl-(pentapeptide) pyrophosphoryl-undecaprenol N-acetylglucosamine transferase
LPETSSGKLAVLAAGGTGGHLFPAQALAQALVGRGWRVVLATDERVQTLSADFPAERRIALSAATFKPGDPFGMVKAGAAILRGVGQARAELKALDPAIVVGFGGYPSLPALIAAITQGRRTLIHEQNAVMGRANRFLAGRVKAVAKGFDNLTLTGALGAKSHLTGNPVRPSVLLAARRPYPDFRGGVLRLLVTGGSQGARIMADIVPAAIELLTPDERARLLVVQQARGEDEARVKAAYARMNIKSEVEPFFQDLPDRIAEAHLVIARAGASTVSELAVIGRPSILVPFPHALDQDQAANAALLEKAGAAIVIKQTLFTPDWLADTIRQALLDREGLEAQAFAAKRTGIADAAERLADLVESLMSPEEPE